MKIETESHRNQTTCHYYLLDEENFQVDFVEDERHWKKRAVINTGSILEHKIGQKNSILPFAQNYVPQKAPKSLDECYGTYSTSAAV